MKNDIENISHRLIDYRLAIIYSVYRLKKTHF